MRRPDEGGGVQVLANGRGWLLCALLAAWVMGPACSCEEDEQPDVGVPADMGDMGSPDADAGDQGDADADAELPPEDMGGDADADQGDADVEADQGDADADVADADGGEDGPEVIDNDLPGSPFEESCLYPVVDCLGASPEALSCSVGAQSGETVVSYGVGAQGGVAARWRQPEGGAVEFEAFEGGQSCYVAVGADVSAAPTGWSISQRGVEGRYVVGRDGDEVTITCADGAQERWPRAQAEPWLPTLLAEDDPLCVRLGAPRCGDDAVCQEFNEQLECCEVAGSSRCLQPAACPEIGDEPPALESCLTPLLECFGRRHVQLACTIDGNVGQTAVEYDRDRRAVLTNDGFDNLTLETANAQGLCFTARMRGERPWAEISFDDANGDDLFQVRFDGEQAMVTCADQQTETQPAAAILEYLPIFPTAEDPTCEVFAVDACSPETQAEDCGAALCCGTLDGNRCLAVEACPEVTGGLRESCVFPLLECFGRNPSLQVCSVYEDLGISQVAYTNGARATFYEDLGLPARQTSNGQSPCFEALELPGGGYRLRDLTSDGAVYELEVVGEALQVTCADGEEEALYPESQLRLLRSYFPAAPRAVECEPPQVQSVCEEDADCQGDGEGCCDLGDRKICAPAGLCGELAPREACATGDGSNCGPGLTCCALDISRVCNPRLCGGEQVCCDVEEAAVCATQARCETFDACDLLDANSCPGDSLCCNTDQGTRCLDVPFCPREDAWETSCLYGTFACLGAENEAVLSCSYNDNAQVTDVSYASGGRVVFFEQFGRGARRASALGQDCFVAVETGQGLEVQDLITQERFVVSVDGATANIQCPLLEGEQEARIEQIPSLELLPYLPVAPTPTMCTPSGGDQCAADADCAELDGDQVCCDTGARRECLPLDTCQALRPYETCQDGSSCGVGEECCALSSVQICDPVLCGDALCCVQPMAMVCASEAACNAVDECDPLDLSTCEGDALCCDTEGGTRCLPGVGACPDGTVENSCLGALLGCFGADNEVDQCQRYEGADVKVVSYASGVEATYYQHYGRPTRRTANGELQCFEATQRAGGFSVRDLLLGDSYEIELSGDEARITCASGLEQVVRSASVRAYLPAAPADNLCDVAAVPAECGDDSDCPGLEVCCDLGDRAICATEDFCDTSRPREACQNDGQCGNGEGCCVQPQVRVCDLSLCPPGELCCNLGTREVCEPEAICEQPVELCSLLDQDGCQQGELCCDTNAGTRCVSAQEGCPDLWEESCLRPVLECQGADLALEECVSSQSTRLEAFYEGGVRLSWTLGGDPTWSSYGPEGELCFAGVNRGESLSLTAQGRRYDVNYEGNRAFVSCPDGRMQRAPRAEIDAYLTAPPVREQCVDPLTNWQGSCLYPILACLGGDLDVESCVDYQPVDRAEVTYSGGQEVIFSGRGEVDLFQAIGPNAPCYQALGLSDEDGYEISSLLGEEAWRLEFEGALARVTCPDDSVDLVDAALVRAALPVRPPVGQCAAAPRNDECQVASDCGGAPGVVCCDTGLENVCLSAENCFGNTPLTLCEEDAECGQGRFCCAQEPARVCDLALCGDEVCCHVPRAMVCGTEDECNGVFNACPAVDSPVGCAQGALCCDTLAGNRCIEGADCPEPPNELEGSCIFETFECFGRQDELDSCVSWPPQVNRTDAVFESGATAAWFVREGAAVLRASFAPLRCFDAVATGDGYQVQDLRTGASFAVTLDGPEAVVRCQEGEVETYSRSAVTAYLPERPAQSACRPAQRDDQCAVNEECAQGEVCCDVGDGRQCVVEALCQRNQPHATCDSGSQCAGGQECCALGGVRVCDPALCGDDVVCCNVTQAEVCGANAECNGFEDVCSTEDEQSCPQGLLCCPTANGTRCLAPEDDFCPPQPDPWPLSCLYPLFECGGDELSLDSCVTLGDGAFVSEFANGASHSYFVQQGTPGREVRRGDQACYTALELTQGEGGLTVTAPNRQSYGVVFQGANAQISCPDGRLQNVPAASLRSYLPSPPIPEQCEDPLEAWRGSCLYSVFSCFGDDNALSSCEDHTGLDFTQVSYDTGNSAVFGTAQGSPLVRTAGPAESCYRAVGSLSAGLEVEDLVTGERFFAQTRPDGVTVDITCAAQERVDTVRLRDVSAYLPTRPASGACEAVAPDVQCQRDQQCGQGEVCCDLGSRVECLSGETCERSRPRPTCEDEGQCEDGALCCPLGPLVVCDADLCGDQPCCSVPEASVCASERECNGIFDACEVGAPNSCGNGASCCETFEGTRCLLGGSCPPPPDPLVGTCLFNIFQCFGRNLAVDSCEDWGDLDLTDVSYIGGRRAVFYSHEGAQGRYVGLEDFFCFEALGDGEQVEIQDLFSGDQFEVSFRDGLARVVCPDTTTFTVAQGAVEAYLPARPAQDQCAEAQPTRECMQDQNCPQGSVCCDIGDEVACLAPDACERYQVRTTCAGDEACGAGEECCALVGTRVCDPSLCGDALCCNLGGQPVCGDSQTCNAIEDACNDRTNQGCGQEERCCDTNAGTRCLAGVQACPPVEDLWPGSCLFAAFECFGAEQRLDACFDFGSGGPTEATYLSGSRARFTVDGQQRLVTATSRGQERCFTATALGLGEGYAVMDAAGMSYDVDFVGDRAQISCPDGDVVNVSRETIEAYLPPRPQALECNTAEEQWQQSCLFGTFACFGTDKAVAQCQDYAGVEVQVVDYTDGSEGTYLSRGDRAVFQARTAQVGCFDYAEAGQEGVYDIVDLTTGESFALFYDGESAQITCPDDEVQVVPRANVEAYLPPAPGACAPAPRGDQCQNDSQCGAPQLVCCDVGEQNQCRPRGDCARLRARTGCEEDAQCGQDGGLCCALEPVRICDPALCGGALCCELAQGTACGDARACAGIFDECEPGDAGSCAPGQVCCDTNAGAACLSGDACPDPIEGTCLARAFGCFGRDAQQGACVDWAPRLDRVEVSYADQAQAIFSGTPQGQQVWTAAGAQDCFVAQPNPDGEGLVIIDKVGAQDVTHTISWLGDEAMITCQDNQTFSVPRAAINAYVPVRPAPGECDAAPSLDQCANNSQCGQGDVCCDFGERRACAPAALCFDEQIRPLCEDQRQCVDGQECCSRPLVRVCDPAICPRGQTCCTIEDLSGDVQVCASEAVCDGVADLCSVNDPRSCAQGSLCCPGAQGLRCLQAQECPATPEPVLDTCLGGLLSCFGQQNTQDQCVAYDDLGLTVSSYESGAAAQFYTDSGGRASVRASNEFSACYLMHVTEGGYVFEDLIGQEGEVEVTLVGAQAQIQCGNEQITVPRSSLEMFVPARPAQGACMAPVRGDLCEDNGDCRGQDPASVCCDAGDRNICGFSDACFFQQPRRLCDDDSACGQGESCCGFALARVCDPSICGDAVCCDLPGAQVCGSSDECIGIYDFCDTQDAEACGTGALCCDTVEGSRCVVGQECPGVVNPLANTCLGGTLGCFGEGNAYNTCERYEAAGVIDARYTHPDQTRRSVQFFSREGREGRRAYNQGFACFNAIERVDGGFTITDTVTNQTFQVAVAGQVATITCPNNTTEQVPAGALRAYLPLAPAAQTCSPPQGVVDDCTQDSQCAQFGPQFVCCDTGLGRRCDLDQFCEELAPTQTCTQDSQCGEGVGCCAREQATVCDPALCNGQVCCTLSNVQTCGGTPGECAVGQSCLADTLSCVDAMPELQSCVNYDDFGVIRASYSGGGDVIYYTDTPSGDPARRTTVNFLPCFQAVEVDGGYQILNLQTNESYQVTVAGQDAQVLCADNSQETVPAEALRSFLPVAPAPQSCQAPTRNDECQRNSDCVGIFGPQALCCDNGLSNQCEPISCQSTTPRETCAVNADCPEGTGCCPQLQARVCDPTYCGDQICCIPNTPPPVCDAICLLCEDNDDCEEGSVCCPFTGSCTAPADCAPEPACAQDSDCAQGLVCCAAGGAPICVVPEQCPDPCSHDGECGNGRVCCGSQSDPYGAYCTAPGQCRDEDNLACDRNGECGNGRVCCRTLDEPACVVAGQCPAACALDSDCGQNQECCRADGRTPICVAAGSCGKELGEPCAQDSECGDGLTCCGYDTIGDVCVPAELCGQQVPRQACSQNPSMCGQFPLAACCEVDGVAVCAPRLACDQPWDVCASDNDCGASGFMCCTELVDAYCVGWTVDSCGSGTPF